MNATPSDPNRKPGACASAACGCHGVDRREFLRLSTLTLAGALAAKLPVMAGPFEAADFEKLVPSDKKLDPAWVKSLSERGQRRVCRGAELDKIGMPIGGLCAGQLYLGGDGKLWHWDIFNEIKNTGDGHYANPPAPASGSSLV